MITYRFELGQRVSIAESGETGKIVGRAEFTYSDHSYLVRYKAADGRAVEAWWADGALEDADGIDQTELA